MRQLIVARKDLGMSPGKLAAQVAHASMAFVFRQLRDEPERTRRVEGGTASEVFLEGETYDEWVCGIFTKTVCEARNRNQLLKAVSAAEGLGLAEGRDFFLIHDACLTEFEPESFDENGQGRVLTCVGFRPLSDDVAHQISRKFQLWR